MAIKNSISVVFVKYVDELGVTIGSGSEQVEAIYNIESISLDGKFGVANYSTEISGIKSEFLRKFEFTYSGGIPSDEAEAAMLASAAFSGAYKI